MMRTFICVFTTVLLAAPHLGLAADKLFSRSDAPTLDASLTFAHTRLSRADRAKHEYTGTFELAGTRVPVVVKPRGKSRLERCKFPPLWLEFDRATTKGTLLAKNKKLKLVTHCTREVESRGYLAAEMLAYRVLNLLTDNSFRVQALKINYTDPDKDRSETHYGFLIEHKKRLAKRLGVKLVEPVTVKRREMDADYTGLLTIYQYFIANVDFSLLKGPPEEGCCHNAVPMQLANGQIISVPYDFDSSGIVDPPYGVPGYNLGLKRLTQRKFRGFCMHNEQASAARQQFLAHKDGIYALLEQFDDIPNLNRGRATKFVNRFYKIMESDKAFNSRITRKCR